MEVAQKKTGTSRKKAATKKRGRKQAKSLASRSRRTAPPLPINDPRAIEKTLFEMHKLLGQQNFANLEEANAFLQQFIGTKDIPISLEDLTPVERAQEKMYDAWNATGKRRVTLAREALEISPDCADAYVLLAEETARTPAEALQLYEQGMQAGERALGAEAFKEDAGHFWGIMETRPYMRARAGVAECLWATGNLQEASFHFRELLRLNPGDNQGNRYMLARLLLRQGLDKELEALLKEYEEEWSAEWLYTRALVNFRRYGASAEVDESLKKAFDQNPFVPAYLMAIEKLPRHLPETIGFGDPNEAVHYLANYMEVWLNHPGALEWFVKVFKEVLEDFDEGADPDEP